MFKRTLVCLDGSKLAEEILPYAAEHCLGFRSEMVLLQVITTHITIPPPESTHVITIGRDSKPDQIHTSDIGKTVTLEPKASLQLKEIAREQGEAKVYLDELADRFNSRHLKVKTVTLQGEAAETILNYTSHTEISLIALTSHGKSGLKRGSFGRVALAVLKKVEVPVLLVKPRGLEASKQR
jgi:nucleotide-binding universal stress UspA family protein